MLGWFAPCRVRRVVLCLFVGCGFICSLPRGGKLMAQDELPRNYRVAPMLEGMRGRDRAALLVVHFGSVDATARANVLDSINLELREHFAGRLSFFEAYSAQSTIKRLAKQGLEKAGVEEALSRLAKERFTHVVVQPSFVVEGVEMEVLRQQVELAKGKFKDIRVGDPLLYSGGDYEAVVRLFTESNLAAQPGAKVLASQGTYISANAQYGQLGYLFQLLGHEDFWSVTVEDSPSIDQLEAALKRKGIRNITLIPCMLVLRDGENNRLMKGFWKEQLEARGFTVRLYPKGLGEHRAMRQLLVQHAEFALQHKRESGWERKQSYQ